MTELSFHRELYLDTAIDEAVKTYGRFASFELADTPSHWIVRVSASTPARESSVARELANYALGLTIKGRKAS